MKFSEIEKQHLFKAWLMISIAFAIVLGGFSFTYEFMLRILGAGLTVGIGFVFHEMAHKFVAQKYGCFAEFRANMNMLWLALIMSWFGFVIAAPGAVMISCKNLTKEKNGKISLAGPLTNLIIAILFFGGLLFLPDNKIFYYGFLINGWLALFNMIPFGIFDGAKVLKWNRLIYISTIIFCFIVMNLAFFLDKI